MPTVVVDASAIAAVLFGEVGASEVQDRLRGMNLIAPVLLRHELVSVALKKMRLDAARRAERTLALRRYPALGVVEREVVPNAVFTLALATGLSAYDTSCLWLARNLGVELVTLDGELAAAAALAP